MGVEQRFAYAAVKGDICPPPIAAYSFTVFSNSRISKCCLARFMVAFGQKPHLELQALVTSMDKLGNGSIPNALNQPFIKRIGS